MEKMCMEPASYLNVMDVFVDNKCPAYSGKSKDVWLSKEETMGQLRISSSTTLQKLRDEGKITYFQISKKWIIYDYQSIVDFVNSKKVRY